MIFEEKSKYLHYRKYPNEQKAINRKIVFNKSVAENINLLIAVFNAEEKALRLNNSILINIAMEYYFKAINDMGEETAIKELRNKVLDYKVA